MSQAPGSDPSVQPGRGATEGIEAHASDEARPEPTVERSRFSQWLASFGLGELQHPLLTRARPPAPRRPAT